MEMIIALVMQFEGFSPVLYDDAGHLAIGYGHRVSPMYAELYKDGMTKSTALKMLTYDLEEAQRELLMMVDVHLTDNQLAALTSLIYNVGGFAFAKSKCLEYLNQGDYDSAAHEAFDEKVGFVKSQGEVLKGLVKRRAKERELFFSQ